MELLNVLDQLNWAAVIIAALSSFLVGFVWYHEAVFGPVWRKLIGMSVKEMNSEGMAKTFGMTGLFAFLTATILACLLYTTGTRGLVDGLVFGAIIGLVFRAGAHVIHNGFTHRSDVLTLIDGGHDVVGIALMGAILGLWM